MSSDRSAGRPVLYATNRQKSYIHDLKRRKGLDDDTYRAMIYDISGGRTDSSKELYRHEAATVISRLVGHEGKSREYLEECRQVVGDIFGLSFSIGILNKGYESADPYENEMNKAKISAFLKERGTVKKAVDRQTLEELKETRKQLQKMKKEGK